MLVAMSPSILPGFAAAFAALPDWLSGRVLACGIAAVLLLFIALFLRGLQKIVMLVLCVVLAIGAFWLVQDTIARNKNVLPPALAVELDGLANRALESPAAKSAWKAIQTELPRVAGDVRERLAAGGDQARKTIANRLEAKAAELRKAGKRDSADELMQLRAKIAP
jgi:hypothetical protein